MRSVGKSVMNGQTNKEDDVYVFIDNSYLVAQGWSCVREEKKWPKEVGLHVNYQNLKQFFAKSGDIRRVVLVGSEIPEAMKTHCERELGFNVFSLPRFPDKKTNTNKEKGVDLKLVWEIAMTICGGGHPKRGKIILCTGDRDFIPIFSSIHDAQWDLEVWLWKNSYSPNLEMALKAVGDLHLFDDVWEKEHLIEKVSAKTRNTTR